MEKHKKSENNLKTQEKKQIPLLDLKREYNKMSEELDRALVEAAKSGQYIMGPAVGELEKEVSNYIGSKYCLGVASGTDALLLSLRALAIKSKGAEYFSPSDEIITTPFTFTATGGSILRAGAKPVFADIDPKTYNINPKTINEAITPNTVGILPVHLYGRPCPMAEIMNLAKDHSLFVLEDAAQAFGATYNGKKVGSIGDLGGFSFFPSKNLGAFGDGGMICTNDRELERLTGMLNKHGGLDKYNIDYIGYNSRLDTIQASILLVKIKHIDYFNSMRRKIAAFYNDQLKDLHWLELPLFDEPGHVYHQYTVRINNGKRNYVQQQLKNFGIATAVYYPVPLHKMNAYAGRYRTSLPLTFTEKACQEVLSLPIEPLLTKEEMIYIVENIKKIRI